MYCPCQDGRISKRRVEFSAAKMFCAQKNIDKSNLIRYYMEVRGVGIINVKTMYGSTSVRDEKTINMIVELLPWTNDLEYDRLGNERYYTKLLDSQVVTYKIPVQSGRNIPAIIEAASKKYRLEQQLGMSVAEELISKAFTSKE